MVCTLFTIGFTQKTAEQFFGLLQDAGVQKRLMRGWIACREADWKATTLIMPELKDPLTIRLDHDVVEWLKKHGKGYRTRINAILRSYMKAQSDARR